MARRCTQTASGPAQPVRCAIYTRKSTTEGLDSEFTSLDAQREACEHYIRSQAYQDWQIDPSRYDDGGYSGGKLERPALQALLREIDAGTVDMLVVYKYDRLSRSMMDFLKLLERLDQRGVGFVSVTQQIDTSSSTGRLLFNMLLSFSQFEREIGSERTRDKIQAARRRGQWTGGRLVLGYGQVPGRKGSLVVIPEEAKIVRLIFDLYLRTGSVTTVAQRLTERGVRQVKKRKGGQRSPGRPWDKNSVLRILRNDLYLGKVRGNGTLYQGEHEALVSQDVFDRVAAGLDRRTTGTLRRSRKFDYLLTGLLRCGPCDAAMTSSSARGRNGKEHRYYRCVKQQNEGTRCATGLLPVHEVEAAVVGQLRDPSRLRSLREAVLARIGKDRNDDIRTAIEEATRQSAAFVIEARRLVEAISAAPTSKLLPAKLTDVERQIEVLADRTNELRHQLAGADAARLQTEKVVRLLEGFDEIWDALVAEERRELLHTLIRAVVMDPAKGGLRIAFHDLDRPNLEATA